MRFKIAMYLAAMCASALISSRETDSKSKLQKLVAELERDQAKLVELINKSYGHDGIKSVYCLPAMGFSMGSTNAYPMPKKNADYTEYEMQEGNT